MRWPSRSTVVFWLLFSLLLLLGGGQRLRESNRSRIGPLLINEVVAANQHGLRDEDGDSSDWLEIHNPSLSPINLAGWALTDDPNQPNKWRFPEMTLAGRQYLLVFASGKNRRTVAAGINLHTNFKIRHQGEFLALYDILADELKPVSPSPLPRQYVDVAYGYNPTGASYEFLANPTPGQANDESGAWVGVVAPVIFSQPHGFYEQPFSLELSSATPEAMIFYTLDGSEPGEDQGMAYSGPISITQTTLVRAIVLKPHYRPSYLDTRSYIFPGQVRQQPAAPAGFSPTWGIHSKTIAGYTKGEPVLADYEMDPAVVNDPRYRERLEAALTAIPSLSIVTAMDNLRIYGEPRMRGIEWERPASVELIYPDQADLGFQINAGLRMQGGEVRWEYMPKHSFRLLFKEQYGAGQLQYPLFPGSPVDTFNSLVLRAGTSESFAGRPDAGPRRSTYAHDEWLRASQIAMSGVGSHGIFVHLYLNGLYWGLYNLVERPDTAFTSAYLGGDKADWFAIKHGFSTEPAEPNEPWRAANHGEPLEGDRTRYETLHRLAQEGYLADPQRYARIKEYLDTARFIDYILLNWYAGRTGDWARNNWYAGVRNPNGQVIYFMWDGENILESGPRIFLGEAKPINRFRPLFEALWQNGDFRQEWVDRTYQHLAPTGALSDENALNRWQAITGLIEEAIIAESARWGDTRTEPPLTLADWQQARAEGRRQLTGNGQKLLAKMREAGYYPAFDPPVFSPAGGLVEQPVRLTLSLAGAAGSSKIYYTTDDSDPRLSGKGAISPSAQLYQEPFMVTTTTRLKARALAHEQGRPVWSALQEATFQMAVPLAALQLTEIMYHPPDGEDNEFFELTNLGNDPVHLANSSFSGIQFTFPPSTPPLPAGQSLVLVRNPAAFQARYPQVTAYPDVAVAGSYEGQLSNKGETIILRDLAGQTILTVTYDDDNGWPLSADGRGDSLVLVAAGGDPNNPSSWRAQPSRYEAARSDP
jgi:hypothetical protein